MAKVTRKRTYDPVFTETDVRRLLEAQSDEIEYLGADEWLAKHAAGYEGPCKDFCLVSSAEYPPAKDLKLMVKENNTLILASVLDGRSKDLPTPLPRDVHLLLQHFDDTTLSAPIQVEKHKCLNFLAALSELVTVDQEGLGALSYGAKLPLKGGFLSGVLYIVNQPDHSFRMLEQTHSVFSLRNEVIAKLSSHCKEFKYLKDDVLAKVNALGYLTKKPEEPAPDDAPQTTRVSLQRIDLLLNWTRNSHYLMHKDSIDSHGMCYLTVIVNITPYASTLLVAGAPEEVSLDTIGKGAFPGRLYHRSGESRRGTVKLAFFFTHALDPALASETKPKDTGKVELASTSATGADKIEAKPVSPQLSAKQAGKQPEE